MSVNPDLQGASVQQIEPEFFNVRVNRKQVLASGIVLFELRLPDGSELPGFTAGAHLTAQVPAGMRRNYSISSSPSQKNYYQIAVKRDAAGRGGSVSMADDVKEGDTLSISAPRNNFELHPRAEKFLFVAGGIGITPVLSMMRHLKSAGNEDFKLIYCTGPEFGKHVQVHHDHGDIDNALDFWPVFETPTKAHVYCCGPRGLMDSVADMTGHWPSGSVHFESFGVDASAYAANTAFKVRLEKTGTTLDVSAEQTILEVLRSC
jgi:phthalate 4,5-dioxygenase reductase subunit